MSCHFESNIDELRRCIRTICANAFADCVSNQRMDICLYHLPVQLLDHLKVEKNSRDSDSLIRIDAVEKNAAGSKILIMWEQLLQAFEETCMDTHAFTSFLEQGQKALRYYYDILVFQETYYDGRLEAMEKIVIGVLNSVKYQPADQLCLCTGENARLCAEKHLLPASVGTGSPEGNTALSKENGREYEQ